MSNPPNATAELGTLIVVVLKARNLIDKHKLYKQDVYAQASLNGKAQKTHVENKGGQHPVWDAELRFPVLKAASDRARKLEISCFSKEPRSDDLLGKGVVDITETLKTGEFDDWVSLNIDGVVRGEVYLEMTYFVSGPAPRPAAGKPSYSNLTVPTASSNQYLQRRPSKLSPSERLSRPPQVTPSTSPNSASAGSGTVPGPSSSQPPSSLRPSSRPASHPLSKGKDVSLPPLPEENSPVPPNNLRAGGATRSQPQAPGSSSRSPALPALLRPGGGNIQGHGYTPEFHPQSDREQRLSPSPSSPPSKVELSLPQQTSPNPYIGTSSYTRVPAEPPSPLFYRDGPNTLGFFTSGAPMSTKNTQSNTLSTNGYPTYTNTAAWNDYESPEPPLTFSFPMPASPAPLSLPQRRYDFHQSYGSQQTEFASASTPQPNPYISERYLNPLPLPPKVPIPEPDAEAHNPSHNSGGLGQWAEEQISQNVIDSDRLEALRRAEEEATQRKEQEKKDLELALQLDRELNTVNVK